MVPLKMLPFDNKNEFQMVVDMPEGTTLEKRPPRRRPWPSAFGREPEVTNYTVFVGDAKSHGFQRPGAPLLPAHRGRTWRTSG